MGQCRISEGHIAMNQSNNQQPLPAGFEALQPFVSKWAGATSLQRMTTRAEADYAEIKDFYDAMVEKAEDAIALINQYPLKAMPEDVENLAKLTLALCQAAVAVEFHGQPRAPGTPYPNSIKLTKGMFPLG